MVGYSFLLSFIAVLSLGQWEVVWYPLVYLKMEYLGFRILISLFEILVQQYRVFVL